MNGFHYRKEIDGLRALAVLPVVLFHAGFDIFSGGYIGVDVFFVISGYLIASIIFKAKEENSFSIFHFYERRARRILPALYSVMIASAILAWFLMLPHQLKDFFESIFATSIFSSNFLFWLESGYFEELAEQKPLLHTWSLAVEEQFYIIFPLFVFLFWRIGKKGFNALLVLSWLLSFGATFWLMKHDPIMNFFLPMSRAWEILSGVLVASYLKERSIKQNLPSRSQASEFLSLIGVLMVCFSIFYFDKETPFPSMYTLIPVLGTVLFIIFGTSSTVIGRFFSFKPLVFIGLVSYSFYLWHFPLLAFGKIYFLGNTPLAVSFALILFSFVLAMMSWKYIETPCRDRHRVKSIPFFAGIGIFFLLFVAIGLKGHLSNGFYEAKLSKLPPEFRAHVVDKDAELKRREPLWNETLSSAQKKFESKTKTRILIIGDSKSEDVYVSLNLVPALKNDYEFRQVHIDDLCMSDVIDFYEKGALSSCSEGVKTISDNQNLANADSVILVATWQKHTVSNADKLATYLAGKGKKVMIIGTGNFNDLPSISMSLALDSIDPLTAEAFFYDNKRADWERISKELESLVKDKENITFKNPYDIFCNEEKKTCSLYSKEKIPYIFDTGHLTVDGAYFFGKKLYDLKWLSSLKGR